MKTKKKRIDEPLLIKKRPRRNPRIRRKVKQEIKIIKNQKNFDELDFVDDVVKLHRNHRKKPK